MCASLRLRMRELCACASGARACVRACACASLGVRVECVCGCAGPSRSHLPAVLSSLGLASLFEFK